MRYKWRKLSSEWRRASQASETQKAYSSYQRAINRWKSMITQLVEREETIDLDKCDLVSDSFVESFSCLAQIDLDSLIYFTVTDSSLDGGDEGRVVQEPELDVIDIDESALTQNQADTVGPLCRFSPQSLWPLFSRGRVMSKVRILPDCVKGIREITRLQFLQFVPNPNRQIDLSFGRLLAKSRLPPWLLVTPELATQSLNGITPQQVKLEFNGRDFLARRLANERALRKQRHRKKNVVHKRVVRVKKYRMVTKKGVRRGMDIRAQTSAIEYSTMDSLFGEQDHALSSSGRVKNMGASQPVRSPRLRGRRKSLD